MNYRKEAEKLTDAYLADLNKLIEVDSTRDITTRKEEAPFGTNVRKALDVMLDIAKRDGFSVKDAEGYAGVIEYGDPANEDTLGILGHLDIVPVGDGWTKDPLKVTVNDGYVFGRGVLDDKGPTMAAYYALKMIRDAGIPLKKRVMLIAGCDEESGMECMNYYASHYENPKMGFVPDAEFPVIYGEKGGAHIRLEAPGSKAIKEMKTGIRINIVTGKAGATVNSMDDEQKKFFDFYVKANGLKGSYKENPDGTYTLHMDGVSSHAAWPEKGINAAVHMLNFIGTAYDDPAAADVADLIRDYTGKSAGIQVSGPYMGPLTMNAGLIEAGPESITVHLDIRYPNETNGQELVEKLQAKVDEKGTPIKAVLESDSAPLFVDPDSKLVTDLMDVYREHTGDTYSPAITIGGGTYARKFKDFVSFGPELPIENRTTDQPVGGCHQPDEGIKLDELINAIAIYADAIVRLAS